MKTSFLVLFLIALSTVSCKTFKVAVPASLADNSEKFHVKGTSVSIFGHKIKIDGYGAGKMRSGFNFRSGTEKRLYPLYFDLDKRLNYISNHFSKEISRSKTKFHFDVSGNGFYATTYCMARSTESSLAIKSANMSIGLSEEYNFNGVIFTNKDAAPWRLYFNGSRDIRNGFPDFLKNTRNTDGVLTNDSTTIDVRLVKINTVKEDNIISNSVPFKLPIGYEFIYNNKTLAFVDMFDRNIWISKDVDERTKVIIISAAVSILAKKHA